MHVLNLHKLDGFECIIQPELPEWLGEEEEDGDDDEDEEVSVYMPHTNIQSFIIDRRALRAKMKTIMTRMKTMTKMKTMRNKKR